MSLKITKDKEWNTIKEEYSSWDVLIYYTSWIVKERRFTWWIILKYNQEWYLINKIIPSLIN